jgi:hypothetical protein
MAEHRLDDQQKYIFKHIHQYLKRSKTGRVLETRKDGRLAAFTIVDLGSAESAFYLFNFRSTKLDVPGASDLLFREMVNLALSGWGSIVESVDLKKSGAGNRFCRMSRQWSIEAPAIWIDWRRSYK